MTALQKEAADLVMAFFISWRRGEGKEGAERRA